MSLLGEIFWPGITHKAIGNHMLTLNLLKIKNPAWQLVRWQLIYVIFKNFIYFSI